MSNYFCILNHIQNYFDLKFLHRINFECAFNFLNCVEIKLVLKDCYISTIHVYRTNWLSLSAARHPADSCCHQHASILDGDC